jgi:poly-D-alanine transfer protein DltD
LFNLLKFNSGKISPDEVKAASKILTYLANTQTAKRLKDVIHVLGANGAEKMDLFFSQLAKVSEKNRIKLLEKLKDSSFAPDKLKKIVEDALNAAKSCKLT